MQALVCTLLGLSGVALSIASLLSLLLQLQEPVQQLQIDYPARSGHYRLYIDRSGGMFTPPLAVLKHEWGPVLGVKLTSQLWANTYYCCDLEIESRSTSAISIVDRRSGESVFSLR